VQPTDLGLVGFRVSKRHGDREEDERGTREHPEELLGHSDEGSNPAAVHHVDGARRNGPGRRRDTEGLLVLKGHGDPGRMKLQSGTP
jgi:hypothetical protein